MSRLVIVSFAFMGWGFFELSGGRDFVAPERPQQQVASPPAAATPAQPTAADSKFQRSAKIRAASLVTTPVLHPASASANRPVTASRPAADPAHRRAVALDKIASAGTSLQSSDTAFAPGAETGLLQMDNIQGGLVAMTNRPASGTDHGGIVLNTALSAADPTPPAPPAESYLDIRQIRASRVNMRQGPGTIYPVIGRLLAGDEVLVVEDSGTGWLQLRTKNGQRVGWVAASLVSKKRS